MRLFFVCIYPQKNTNIRSKRRDSETQRPPICKEFFIIRHALKSLHLPFFISPIPYSLITHHDSLHISFIFHFSSFHIFISLLTTPYSLLPTHNFRFPAHASRITALFFIFHVPDHKITIHDSLLPTPFSRLPINDFRLPTPYSLFPILFNNFSSFILSSFHFAS